MCVSFSEPKELVNSEKPEWLKQMEPILETLNGGTALTDDSEQVLFVNTVFEEATGFPPSSRISTGNLLAASTEQKTC